MISLTIVYSYNLVEHFATLNKFLCAVGKQGRKRLTGVGAQTTQKEVKEDKTRNSK